MAKTIKEYTGFGRETTYSLTFELGILSWEHVSAYIIENDIKIPVTITPADSNNPNNLDFTANVDLGTKFYVQRKVPKEPYVDYTGGAALNRRNLNNSNIQILMILEEIDDGVSDVVNNTTIDTIVSESIQRTDNSTGVIAGLGITDNGNDFTINIGYGFSSAVGNYNTNPSDLDIRLISVLEPITYSDFTGLNGLYHIGIAYDSDQVFLFDSKESVYKTLLYLGYCIVDQGSLIKAVSMPEVVVDTARRLNKYLENNTEFKNLNIKLNTTEFSKGLELSSGLEVRSNANNYQGEIGAINDVDLDVYTTQLVQTSFIEFAYNNGDSQLLISSSNGNISSSIIDIIDDRSFGYASKNLINQWQNIRICVNKKGELGVTRGQVDYDSKVEAENAVLKERFDIQPTYKDYVPVYALTIQAGATDYSDVTLTKLYREPTKVDHTKFTIDDFEVGTHLTAHPSTFEGNPKWRFPLVGQELNQLDYPEMAQLDGFIDYDVIVNNLTETNFNSEWDYEDSTIKRNGFFKTGGYLYVLEASEINNETKIKRTLDGLNFTDVVTIPNKYIAYVAAKDPFNVFMSAPLYSGSQISGTNDNYMVDIINGTYEVVTGQTIEGTVGAIIYDFNETRNEWVIGAIQNGTDFVIKTSPDAMVWTTQYTSPVLGTSNIRGFNRLTNIQPDRRLYDFNEYNFKGLKNKYNGEYYCSVTDTNQIIKFNENDLTQYSTVYTSNNTIESPIVIEGDIGIVFDSVINGDINFIKADLINQTYSEFNVSANLDPFGATHEVAFTILSENLLIVNVNEEDYVGNKLYVLGIDPNSPSFANDLSERDNEIRLGGAFILIEDTNNINNSKVYNYQEGNIKTYEINASIGISDIILPDFTDDPTHIDPKGRHVTAIKVKP